MDPAPLLRMVAAGVEWQVNVHDTTAMHRGRPNDTVIARRLGVSRESVQRWRNGHRIEANLADRLATRLGWHPIQVWGIAAYNELVREPRSREPEID